MSPTFSTIIADPPWLFGDKLPGRTRGAARNYPVLGVEAIRAFQLPPMTEDAYLLLWRVASQQEEALSVAKAWGFVVKTEIVWVKTTTKGRRHFGMGHHLRAEHEVCLVATRGKPKPLLRSTRTVITAPYTRHSEKPGAFYQLALDTFPGPIVELFARTKREGFITIGNEIDGRDAREVIAEMRGAA